MYSFKVVNYIDIIYVIVLFLEREVWICNGWGI